MTEDDSRDTMREVSHTNPDDPRNVFGELFRRGPSTVADGGQSAQSADERTSGEAVSREENERTMAEVSHTASDAPDVNEVWERGQR
ncbi:hypothetical protein [Halospeciosus flavus]|uniref:Uncharacterized protein n=1 Tax=Halospeciosus flavus TaxID=3032283 RepID=A0ABD5Z8F5_9EURY|nr:hypothetical protein [Halospeciosus flavus]